MAHAWLLGYFLSIQHALRLSNYNSTMHYSPPTTQYTYIVHKRYVVDVERIEWSGFNLVNFQHSTGQNVFFFVTSINLKYTYNLKKVFEYLFGVDAY